MRLENEITVNGIRFRHCLENVDPDGHSFMSDNNEMTRLAFQDASAQFKQSLKQATMLKAYSGEPKRKSNGAADETPGTTKA